MNPVRCRACGADIDEQVVDTHVSRHRAEFVDQYGREPEDYEEVIELLGDEDRFGGGDDDQTVPLTEWAVR